MAKEIEVKYKISDLAEIRSRLNELGAKLTKPRHFEDNVVLDTPDDQLRKKQHLLRLRSANSKAILTYKTGMEFKKTRVKRQTVKVRNEFETEVSNPEAAKQIFEQLGYTARRGYQKYREVWTLDRAEIFLDELPFGKFIEIEGAESSIIAVAEKLRLLAKDRITAADNKTYEVMWQEYSRFKE